ncbi:unnamed protein product, partial [Staurois parvus]
EIPVCQLQHIALYCSALLPKQCADTVKHKTQHTVNPFIAPDVNCFLPSAISTESVLFISTDHCIGVTGDASDSQFPPVSECPPQSHYKSLITAITSKKKKKIPVSMPPIVITITFT